MINWGTLRQASGGEFHHIVPFTEIPKALNIIGLPSPPQLRPGPTKGGLVTGETGGNWEAKRAQVKAVLSNSFGFGGTNASLIFSAAG